MALGHRGGGDDLAVVLRTRVPQVADKDSSSVTVENVHSFFCNLLSYESNASLWYFHKYIKLYSCSSLLPSPSSFPLLLLSCYIRFSSHFPSPFSLGLLPCLSVCLSIFLTIYLSLCMYIFKSRLYTRENVLFE